MGRVSPHSRPEVLRLRRCQARDRERNLEDSRKQQGHQQATDQPEDLLPARPQLDAR
ncbi:hypothetical protein IG631_15157 [Alternaria alternata]|nr:hypothetical protein IG631_15157 [Alternaria alternata]